MNRITIRRHGSVYGVYYNGAFQCYWRPLSGTEKLFAVASTLIAHLGPATVTWTA